MAWLARERPGLVGRYRRLYRRGAYVPGEYRDWLDARVRPLLERYGLGPTTMRKAGDEGETASRRCRERCRDGRAGDADAGYPAGSLPRRSRSHGPAGGAEPGPAADGEQPRLL